MKQAEFEKRSLGTYLKLIRDYPHFFEMVKRQKAKEIFNDLDNHKQGYDFLHSIIYKELKEKHLGKKAKGE